MSNTNQEKLAPETWGELFSLIFVFSCLPFIVSAYASLCMWAWRLI